MQALFPIRIEHIANGVFYLGQGGETVHEGARYHLIKQGEAIIDSYTHEVLGREQTEIGELEVFDVQPRFSKAKLIGKPIEITDAGQLIATPEKPKKLNGQPDKNTSSAADKP